MTNTETLSKFLAKRLGIEEAEVDRVLNDVKSNMEILDACEGPHIFSPVEGGGLNAKCICLCCGGVVRFTDAMWYVEGFRAGLKYEKDDDAEDIIEMMIIRRKGQSHDTGEKAD